MPQRQPKWRRKPGERPQQILDAALEVFGETGIAGARLDEIADRAQVSKGTIYLYFTNKEELFKQAIRQALTPATPAESTHGQQRPPVSPTGQLLDTISRQWEFLTSPRALTVNRLVLAEQWQFPELAELYYLEVVSRFIDSLSPIIRRGSASGEFRELDPEVAARMLTALTLQSALWTATKGAQLVSEKNSEAVLPELLEFYLQAITPSENAFPQADGAL